MKKIPVFISENEESEFWDKEDSTDYIDWNKAESATFSNLKPTAKTISIRLPQNMLDRLRIEANKLDVPYQSLMKIILSDGLKRIQKPINI